MHARKPTPLIPIPIRKRCPVCGEVSYSRYGIHPQCSMRRADVERKNRIKLEKTLADAEKPVTAAMLVPASRVSAWQKNCPMCNALQHVRKVICGCGHTFAIKARLPVGDGEQP